MTERTVPSCIPSQISDQIFLPVKVFQPIAVLNCKHLIPVFTNSRFAGLSAGNVEQLVMTTVSFGHIVSRETHTLHFVSLRGVR